MEIPEALKLKDKREIIDFIQQQMENKSFVFKNINWASLPEEYLNFFRELKNNTLDEKELLEFLNSTGHKFAKQLKEHTNSSGSEITLRLTEKHPVAAARRFFRDWLQVKRNEDELKK